VVGKATRNSFLNVITDSVMPWKCAVHLLLHKLKEWIEIFPYITWKTKYLYANYPCVSNNAIPVE